MQRPGDRVVAPWNVCSLVETFVRRHQHHTKVDTVQTDVMFIMIVVALDEMHSSAVLSLLVFFCEVAVGVDERDQSASAQTAPQQAGFDSD